MRPVTASALLLALVGLTVPLASSGAFARASGAEKTLKAVDTDNDGSIDLKEATAAAEATFTKLDKDNDGSVDTKELQGRLSKKDLKAADPDNDGHLEKKEYTALVEQRFKAADPDGDGTVDAKELKTPAGRALSALLK